MFGPFAGYLLKFTSIAAILAPLMTDPSLIAWTPIIVKNVNVLGPQNTPDVTGLSRDGGFSTFIDNKLIWLFDDSECIGTDGNQLSFISNTAAYLEGPDTNLTLMQDFGVEMVGKDKYGRKQFAIIGHDTVGSGGWIPFFDDESDFNTKNGGTRRVAIWPGASPTPLNTTHAILLAPVVYVTSKPTIQYEARGMTLVVVSTTSSGPVASRPAEIVIPGTDIPYGGFATLIGNASTSSPVENTQEKDVYLIGIASHGLQVARVNLGSIGYFPDYSFFDTRSLTFTNVIPSINSTDSSRIYLPGSFSSGSMFFSPFFATFVLIYFNMFADSTFYVRYLDLDQPLTQDPTWTTGGKLGDGIATEDAEAIVKYAWSPEQKLYGSTPGKGGYNYAANAHPEFYNGQYLAQSLYPEDTAWDQRRTPWLGAAAVKEDNANGDGRHLMLSWTSQIHGGLATGVYQIYMAVIEFDDIPTRAINGSSTIATSGGAPPWPTRTGIPSSAAAVWDCRSFWTTSINLLGLSLITMVALFTHHFSLP
ncbi:hypothetical protein MMC25_001012 [Agyrium rufum]|nr:hypothetical protein [Agyrium rufum]